MSPDQSMVTSNGSSAQTICGTNAYYVLTIANIHASEKVSAMVSSLAVTNLLNIIDGTFVSASGLLEITIRANRHNW